MSKDKGTERLHKKVKTARGRKLSSTKWLQRQLNDPYVQKAKSEGYRSRAAYKLLEINDKFKFLKPNKTVIDLGSTPGGWTQVALKYVGADNVLAIDINPMEEVPGSIFIQHDFMDPAIDPLIHAQLKEPKVDIILSDMAAPATGHAKTDHLKIMALCEAVFDFAKDHLKPEGICLAKIFQGGAENEVLASIKQQYRTVKHVKPNASRKDSSETYIIAQGFRNT